ncbi:predicted protein, partial [Postia placenta Mad-698-R]
MTDEQRKELYEVLDYDEKAALAESFETPRDALKTRVVAQLNRGSLALKTDPHGKNTEVISVVSDVFQATFIQRPDNFETSLSLGGFAVYDGTTKNTLYPQIVHVQQRQTGGDVVKTQVIGDEEKISEVVDPFLFVRFEQNPLDERADSALEVKMRYMEIVYHRGYVEAIYKFFKPPASQIESVEALLDAASQTLEGLRKETRAGLEHALQTHKTIDVHMDLNAPIIIIPEDITTNKCKHLMIDAGHIAVRSELGNKQAIKEIRAKRKQEYTDEDYKRLESMMYDRLSVNLKDAQVQNSIVPTVYSLPRFKVSGRLPSLQANLSDSKYKALMRLIDVAIPNFDDAEAPTIRPTMGPQLPHNFRLPSGLFGNTETEYNVEDGDDGQLETEIGSPEVQAVQNTEHGPEDEFYDVVDGVPNPPALRQHIVEFNFQVDMLRASLHKSNADGSERAMGEVAFERFSLDFTMMKYVMTVDVNL